MRATAPVNILIEKLNILEVFDRIIKCKRYLKAIKIGILGIYTIKTPFLLLTPPKRVLNP